MKLDSGYVCLQNNTKILVLATPPPPMTDPEQGYWDSFPDIY